MIREGKKFSLKRKPCNPAFRKFHSKLCSFGFFFLNVWYLIFSWKNTYFRWKIWENWLIQFIGLYSVFGCWYVCLSQKKSTCPIFQKIMAVIFSDTLWQQSFVRTQFPKIKIIHVIKILFRIRKPAIIFKLRKCMKRLVIVSSYNQLILFSSTLFFIQMTNLWAFLVA